jgi:hypothetical protein
MAASCDESLEEYNYTFTNETSYPIQVTIPNKENRFQAAASSTTSGSSESSVPAQKGPFTLSANTSVNVYIKSSSIEFEWTAAYNSADNLKIYPEIKSGKVTFRSRD